MIDLEVYAVVSYISLLAAAFTVTAFPLLYSLGPWYKDELGRALMWKALSFALIVDLTVLFALNPPSNLRLVYVVHTLAFGLVAVTTGYLTWMLWVHNFIPDNRKKKPTMLTNRAAYQASIKTAKPLVSDTVFKVLRRLVEAVLPATAALYFTLSEIWGLPYTEQIVGTIAAVATFLGAAVHLSRKVYEGSEAKYDGDLVVDTSDPERDVYRLDIGDTFENLAAKDELVLKVKGGQE